jgi:Ca-activated chloride channel family protein
VDLGSTGDRRSSPKDRYVPDVVVLLTDGANRQGIDPMVAAQQALDRRVRVFTIGFGTSQPAQLVCTPEQIGAGGFAAPFGGGGGFGGGGFGGGGPQNLVIDEPTLQSIADVTGGTYFRAENADQLVEVFHSLPARVIAQQEDQELTVAFLMVGALLALLAGGLSLRWNRMA